MNAPVNQAAMAAQAQQQAAAQNMAARQLILRGGFVPNVGFVPPAVDMWQPLNPILPAAVAPGSVITVPLRNVGLVKRLIVQFKATVTAGASTTSTLTKWGLQNFISNVTFQDLGSNTRINTPGWHLTAVSSAKRRRVFAAAYTSDSPNGYGNNNNRVMFAPSSIAATNNSEIDFVLEIPFVKDDQDLRGAIYANVTNANMFVQITLNPNMFVSSTADPTLAMYQSGGTDLASLSGVTLQVYQNYLDQLPKVGGVPVLPQQDIGTAYLLLNSVSGLPVANQDNSVPFVNARTFESVTFFYDNNGTQNVNASDLNYIQLQSANFTNIWNLNGKIMCLRDRNVIMDDFPPAMHYFDFRHRPIDTNQYGNMQLVTNPSSVGGAAAYFGYGWEGYGIIGLVNQAGSIPSGGGS